MSIKLFIFFLQRVQVYKCKTMYFFSITLSSLRDYKLCLVSALNCLYKEILRFNSETVKRQN